MNKRTFLKLLGGVVAAPAGVIGYRSLQAGTEKPLPDSVKVTMDDNQKIVKIEISDAEWKKKLSQAQYKVLRKEGTERPFTSELNDEKRHGIYACAGCDLPLFSSETKFDSGTGWPSFFDAIPDHIGTSTDFKLIFPRTEYHCIRCGGHQGHVFKDGPQPTGLRYCNNGVALNFTAA